MRHIFGFVDNYSKVNYWMRDTLQLSRKHDNDALFRTAVAGAGKVVFSKLAWSATIVQPNEVRKVNLYKSITVSNVIPVSFRKRRCETFYLPQAKSTVWRLGRCNFCTGLQTENSGNQENNTALINHCSLTNMQVWLNHSRYPSVDMATDFTKELYGGVYKSFCDFASRYSGIDNLLTGSSVNPATFKSLYPIHVFDVSKQSERLREGVVDLAVRIEFSANVPANTQAYSLVTSDRILKFKNDGSKMSVLF